MKKLKHSILSLLLLMGACIVSCSNDDGQTSSTCLLYTSDAADE